MILSPARKRSIESVLPHTWLPVAIVLVAGIALAAPLWLTPYLPDTHDGQTHIFNLFALDRQIQAGNLYPLRFPEWGYGYGYAVLSYYPPLGYYLMELWRLLGVDYVAAYKAAFTLMILAAGLTSYGLGTALFNRTAGLLVALAYLYNPYFISDIYTRAAWSETLALAVAPLVFLGFYRAMTEPGWRSYFLASLALALLVLAHPLSTFLFAGFLGAFVVLLFFQVGRALRWRGLGVLAAAGFTAGLLTCFYWLPARLEAGGLRIIDGPLTHLAYLNDLKAARVTVPLRLDYRHQPRQYNRHLLGSRPLPAGLALIYFFWTWRQPEHGG